MALREHMPFICRYILLNDCFTRLSMNLFGCWVDGEAAIDSIPFCHSLVQVAVATNNEKLKRFIKDDMLPAIIRRLYDDLPCAVQKTIRKLSPLMNSINCRKATKDLLVLCQEIYKVYIRCKVVFHGFVLIPFLFVDYLYAHNVICLSSHAEN